MGGFQTLSGIHRNREFKGIAGFQGILKIKDKREFEGVGEKEEVEYLKGA